jgi:hypothetical protein
MATRRRYLTFSLRTLFILLTLFAVWTAIVVRRATEQREAVKAIEAVGGQVFYDWQVRPSPIAAAGPLILNPNAKPPVPEWLRRVVGDHFFQKTSMVYLLNLRIETGGDHADRSRRYYDAVMNSIPSLQRLRGLKLVGVWHGFPEDLKLKLTASLPNCTVFLIFPAP